MNSSKSVIRLSLLIAVMALAAAGTGLFWQGGGAPFLFTTLRGQTVEIYGQGLYRFDTVFTGAGNRGLDLVMLTLGIPALLICTYIYRRGSLWGSMLQVGMLGYLLYVYVSFPFGSAYNSLFLLYVGIFSASFFALVMAFTSVDLRELAAGLPRMPRQGLAAFMFISGLLTLFVWSEPLVTALIRGEPPLLLDSYTSPFTYGFDLAIIVPVTFITGVKVLRRDPLGYLLAMPLLCIIIMLVPQIAAQTAMQLAAGVTFSAGQIIGPMAGFLVLGLVAVWLLAGILRSASHSEYAKSPGRASITARLASER